MPEILRNHLSYSIIPSHVSRHTHNTHTTHTQQLREKYAGEGKFMPIDLREKKTRAIRRRLTKEQVGISFIIYTHRQG
jgi:fatty acid desaturase